MLPWGGWDVALEPLLVGQNAATPAESQAVLKFMVTQQARENLRHYLSVSRLPAVQTLMKTAELTTTQRFVPASRPGRPAAGSRDFADGVSLADRTSFRFAAA